MLQEALLTINHSLLGPKLTQNYTELGVDQLKLIKML